MKNTLTLILIALFLFPVFSYAVGISSVSIPFGGHSKVVVPCTCSFGVWIQYTPFFMGGKMLPVGALTYRPPKPSKPYAYFTAGLPGIWYLGKYLPTPGTCWVGVAPYCVPLPDYGVIDYVGTGMPSIPIPISGVF